MIHHDIPDSLAEYVTLLQTLGHKDRSMRKGFQNLRQSRTQPKSFGPGNTRTFSGPSSANKSTTFVSNTTLPSVKIGDQLSGEPMDLSMQEGSSFANKPEMNRCRAEGLYPRFGVAGHFLANCLHDIPQISIFNEQLLLMPTAG